jgi:transcriptional regulator with XRE-family HTH domain
MTYNQLKKWRKRNGYSQSQLARALSVDVMTISRWERQLRKIPPFLHLALECLEIRGGEKKTKGMRIQKKKGE